MTEQELQAHLSERVSQTVRPRWDTTLGMLLGNGCSLTWKTDGSLRVTGTRSQVSGWLNTIGIDDAYVLSHACLPIDPADEP